MAVETSEVQFWRKVSADLGINVIAPFETNLSDGTSYSAPALVESFGTKRGMVVAADYAVIEPFQEKLLADGYGFSCIEGSVEGYSRVSMIKVLKDWGWHGAPKSKPIWLR